MAAAEMTAWLDWLRDPEIATHGGIMKIKLDSDKCPVCNDSIGKKSDLCGAHLRELAELGSRDRVNDEEQEIYFGILVAIGHYPAGIRPARDYRRTDASESDLPYKRRKGEPMPELTKANIHNIVSGLPFYEKTIGMKAHSFMYRDADGTDGEIAMSGGGRVIAAGTHALDATAEILKHWPNAKTEARPK